MIFAGDVSWWVDALVIGVAILAVIVALCCIPGGGGVVEGEPPNYP